MERKYKIRIVFAAVVLAAALLLVGIISGFFGYLFRGYKAFFKKDVYIVRQMYVSGECEVAVSDGAFNLSTKSSFSNTELKHEVLVSVREKKGKKQIVLTFKNDYSLSGGTLFSGLFLDDAKNKAKAPFDYMKKTTEVFLLNGDSKTQCPLSAYKRNRKTLKMYYDVTDGLDVDKILVSGFVLTEAKRK